MSNAKRDRLADEISAKVARIEPAAKEIAYYCYVKGYDSRQPEIDKLRKALERIKKANGLMGLGYAVCVAEEALEGAE